jgi:hypothetical protein
LCTGWYGAPIRSRNGLVNTRKNHFASTPPKILKAKEDPLTALLRMEEISIVKLGSPQASHWAWGMPSDEGGIVTSSKVLICFEFLKQTMIF